MNILGVESSCDETSAAVVRNGREILSNVVSSQIELHRPYGGVIPELAARQHLQRIDLVIAEALARSGLSFAEIDAVAATYGPGLAISLLIGLNAAKGIALTLGKPFLGINHVEAHLYSPLLIASAGPGEGGFPPQDVFPMIALVVSGGHTILAAVDGVGQHEVLGQTLDDAAGEAFDKVAKLLGLGYPGGPEIDRRARAGNPQAIRFPRSMLDVPGYDFSFSGLKTAVLYHVRNCGWMDGWKSGRMEERKNDNSSTQPSNLPTFQSSIADICASFQEAVVDVLVAKILRAAEARRAISVSASGGVAVNRRFRERLGAECRRRGLPLLLAPPELCTDNAAMIAALADHKLRQGSRSELSLEVAPSIGLGER